MKIHTTLFPCQPVYDPKISLALPVPREMFPASGGQARQQSCICVKFLSLMAVLRATGKCKFIHSQEIYESSISAFTQK